MGVGTLDSPTFAGSTIDAVRIGISATNEIDTTSGNLILDSTSGTVQIDDNVLATGTITARAAATQDSIILQGRAGGTSSYGVTITPQTLTASRTLTLPNTTGTVVTTGDSGTVTSTMIADGISLSKLASGTSSQIIIANASGVPTYTTISGDITISNTGVTSIEPNSVALGTDTTGDYVSSLTAGTGVILSGSSGEGAIPTIAIGQAVGTTASVTFNSVLVTGALGRINFATDGGGNISMGRIDSTSSTPYIDFNSSATPSDFDVRILASGGNGTPGNGMLTISGNTVITGNLTVNGTAQGTVNTATSYAFTAPQTISTSSSLAAFRVTQTGSGNALEVEDSTNPDTTPFVIKADGRVGIGTESPDSELHVAGTSTTGTIRLGTAATETIASIYVADAGAFTLGSVVAKGMDLATNNATRLQITDTGLVSVGGTAPTGSQMLIVNSTIGNKALVVQAASGQTANIQEWQNSSSNVLAFVDKDGKGQFASIDGSATFTAFASSTTLTIGYSGTAASTINISTGSVAAATTKTINIGTGGAASSTTNVNLGSANGGTTTINGNLVVTGSMNSISSSSSGTYTLQLSDANKILEFTSAVTVSVPGSNVAFPVGTSITIVQQGTGQVTIASAANVDIVTGLQATLSTGTAVVTLTVGTTSNILVGQSLVKTSGTGAFGASAKVLSIQSSTQFTASINHATAGAITFKTTDIVLRSSTGTKTRTQYSVATLIKRSDTEWWIMGDTTP